MTTGNTSDSAVVGNRAKTHLGRVAQHCVTVCVRVTHRLLLSRLRLRDSKLTCALASHAQPGRHALPGLHLFSLRGEGAEATRAVPHRSLAPPPASSPKINAGPSSRGPEAPSPPIRGSGGERRAFVPQQNRINLHQISQATARGPRGSYVTAVTLVERVSAL